MICPNCQEETKGIKINGKIFCSVCGEKIENATEEAATKEENIPVEEVIPPTSATPEPKIIPKTDSAEYEMLKTELAALEVIEDVAIKEEKKEEDAFLAELDKENSTSKSKAKPDVKIKKDLENKAKNKPKIEKRTIIKHNRKRMDLKPEHFMIVPGEPNPITTPELEYPTEMEVGTATEEIIDPKPKDPKKIADETGDPKKSRKEKTDVLIPKIPEVESESDSAPALESSPTNILDEEMNYPLFGKSEINEIEKKKQKKQQALTGFLKAGVNKNTKTSKKKKNKKKKSNILIKLSIAIAIIIPIAGLFAYVNLYWINPKVAQKKAEEVAQFYHEKPSYIPLGYEIDNYTKGSEKELEYHYTYLADEEKTLSIKISEYTKSETEIFNEIVKKSGGQYIDFIENGYKYWSVEEKKLIFKRDNLLYVILASDKISTDELLKIAEGLI